MHTYIGADCPSVVDLIGQGNEQYVSGGFLKVANIRLLLFTLWQLRERVSVGAAQNDICHPSAEALANYWFQLGALVLDGVVKYRCDGLALIPTVLKHQAGDAKQVARVWRVRPFPLLPGMDGRGILDALR